MCASAAKAAYTRMHSHTYTHAHACATVRACKRVRLCTEHACMCTVSYIALNSQYVGPGTIKFHLIVGPYVGLNGLLLEVIVWQCSSHALGSCPESPSYTGLICPLPLQDALHIGKT